MNGQTATQAWSHRWLLRLAIVVLLAGAPLFGAPRFLPPEEELERLVVLIDQRLALMPEVAAWKFRRGQPVTDPDRERVVIEQAVADAEAVQLDGLAARNFFALQIQLARAVQENFFALWRASAAPPPESRDLATELRPLLDSVGRALPPAIYRAANALADLSQPQVQEQLARLRRHAGLSEPLLGELARTMGALRIHAAPTWQSVQRTGVLRVGMTGDYPPFSDDRGGELRGLDVQLALSLAKAWGVEVAFVRTSWPTLMADLARRRFEVALSGISITPERSRQAGFSSPYLVDGKTPIARREDAARFSSLAQIDQPGVRVIVNPGGTNERFVREHLGRAQILVHADNRTIFQEIIAGRADVMITDGVEVRLQTLRHPELAGTMATLFTQSGKAILLPAASELGPRIDAWLAPQVERGQIAVMLEQAEAAAK